MPGKDCLQKYPTFPADPTNYVALKVWAEAVEIAGSFDAEAVAQVPRSHTFDTMLGTLGFDEKGDVTGIEMWSWYRWENGTVVEKAPSELPPTEKPIWGLLFYSVFPYQKKKLGRGLGKSAAKTG